MSTAWRSLVSPWWSMTKIFLSYRREHTAIVVGRLHDRLADHFGAGQIVRDIATVNPGDLDQRIDEVVASAAACLVIISDRWLLDRNPGGKRALGIPRDWVEREIEVALRQPHVLVIPVLIEDATLPAEQALPYSIKSLAGRKALHLSNLNWKNDIGRLIEALEEGVKGAASATAALPPGAPAWPAAEGAPPPPADLPTRRWFRRH